MARSVVLKGWAGNVYQGAAYWLNAERCWDSLALHLSERQAIDVRYEELVTDPEGVLSAICRFIGVDYSPEMLAYSTDAPQYPPPDPTLAGLWSRKLAPRDVALVEQRIGGLLGEARLRGERLSQTSHGRLRQTLLLSAGRLEGFEAVYACSVHRLSHWT